MPEEGRESFISPEAMKEAGEAVSNMSEEVLEDFREIITEARENLPEHLREILREHYDFMDQVLERERNRSTAELAPTASAALAIPAANEAARRILDFVEDFKETIHVDNSEIVTPNAPLSDVPPQERIGRGL